MITGGRMTRESREQGCFLFVSICLGICVFVFEFGGVNSTKIGSYSVLLERSKREM